MNIKTNFPPFRLVVWSMIWLVLSGLPAVAKAGNPETVVVLTKYNVKEGYGEQFREALKNYVAQALVHQNNIMAEAYAEQEHPLVFWVIERWNSKSDLEKIRETKPFKAIAALAENALSQTAQKIWLKDLEPVSRKQWRTLAGASDTPLTIMLFVDAKPGTEHRFREVYHEAMPRFRSEPGVINYQLSQFADDSTRFVTYERFRSEAAFQYHLNFPPIQPVIDYLHTSIKKQPFETGLHRLIALAN